MDERNGRCWPESCGWVSVRRDMPYERGHSAIFLSMVSAIAHVTPQGSERMKVVLLPIECQIAAWEMTDQRMV